MHILVPNSGFCGNYLLIKVTGKITLKGLREETVENHSATTTVESDGKVSELEDIHEV